MSYERQSSVADITLQLLSHVTVKASHDTAGLSHQNALVHVSVVHVQTDSDDAAVVHLLVIERQRERGVAGHTGHRALVWARRHHRRGRHRRRGRAAGARTRAKTRGIQRRERRGLPELSERERCLKSCQMKGNRQQHNLIWCFQHIYITLYVTLFMTLMQCFPYHYHRGAPRPLDGQINFKKCSVRSQEKSLKVTFPI